jgi:aspartyl aminopeptidase
MAKLSKKQIEELKKRLEHKAPTVWEKASARQRKDIFATAERYKEFLDQAKTERLAVEFIRDRARAAGFRPLEGGGRGRKVYAEFQGKVIALAVLGQAGPEQGLRLIGTHIDAPRLDLKMHPLYENQNLAFLKTHYYGGIKKYQWFARPLAIHGVVCTTDGKSVRIDIGEEPGDPVFTVLDLLPHLSRKLQSDKKLSEAFEAERMNLLIGGLPLEAREEAEGKDLVKLAVLEQLQRRYGITEADLISAELEIVPAGRARDVGLDRALVGAYGQDDRSCAFAALEAMMGLRDPAMSCVALFVDKEEIGSEGATGARSRFLELFTARLLARSGVEPGYLAVAGALAASQALSGDVTAAFDPDYPEVHEKLNAAYLGRGVVLTKYTGHGGKYNASEAGAEYVAWLRGVWDAAGVVWQAAGMGRIDEGGGGTIAKFLAVHGMEIVDAGPPLLSMHSPFEISHKADIYSTVQAFRAFFQAPPRR